MNKNPAAHPASTSFSSSFPSEPQETDHHLLLLLFLHHHLLHDGGGVGVDSRSSSPIRALLHLGHADQWVP